MASVIAASNLRPHLTIAPKTPELSPCPHGDGNACEQYRRQGQLCQDCPLLTARVVTTPPTPRMVPNDGVPETRLVGDHRIAGPEAEAARKAADAGGTARDQIDAARAAGGRALKYTPHCGKKERMKNLARMAKRREEYEHGSDAKK